MSRCDDNCDDGNSWKSLEQRYQNKIQEANYILNKHNTTVYEVKSIGEPVKMWHDTSTGILEYTFPPPSLDTEKKDDRKHNHYYKDVSKYDYIDVYRVIDLFDVTDPVLQHIVKKCLCAGIRGHKNLEKDITDIYDSAKRLVEMFKEDQKE